MTERRFESSDVMETVVRAVQPVKGTMSSDTSRVGRSMTPKYQKHSSRSPAEQVLARGIPVLEAQAVKDTILAPKRQ